MTGLIHVITKQDLPKIWTKCLSKLLLDVSEKEAVNPTPIKRNPG